MAADKFSVYRENYGFTKDKDMVELNSILGRKLKELRIDAYTNAPYRLLLRTVEHNAKMKRSDDRFIICKNDKHETSITNILASDVDNYIMKWYNSSHLEIVMQVQDLYYRILIVL